MGSLKGKRWNFFIYIFFKFFACHFLEPLKFVWGLPKWIMITGKNHILYQEKIGETDFTPSEKCSSYAFDRPADRQTRVLK